MIELAPWVRIYALCEFPSWEPRYVGKTVNFLHKRHKDHIRAASKPAMPRLPVHRWLRKRIAAEQRLAIQLLENVAPGADWVERERHWIETLRENGASLLNLTSGGEGLSGHSPSAETRQKIAASLRSGGTFNCEICGTPFWRKRNEIVSGDCRFCSRICYKTSLRGKSKPVSQKCMERGIIAAAAARRAKTQCKRGHLLSGDNLYLNPHGSRVCKACRKTHKATHAARRVTNG